MDNAVTYLNHFLDICLQSKNNSKLCGAYRRLSEVESKKGNTVKAIEHLSKVLGYAQQDQSRAIQAEATLRLGLLFN